MKTIEEKLEVVRLSYERELPEKMMKIDKAYISLCSAKTLNTESLYEFYILIHNLIGSGTTFGFTELSILAKALDVKIKVYIDTKKLPTEEELKSYSSDLEALKHAVLNTKRD